MDLIRENYKARAVLRRLVVFTDNIESYVFLGGLVLYGLFLLCTICLGCYRDYEAQRAGRLPRPEPTPPLLLLLNWLQTRTQPGPADEQPIELPPQVLGAGVSQLLDDDEPELIINGVVSI